MSLGKSILFAALMTLLDELQSEVEKESSTEIDGYFNDDHTIDEISYDAAGVKNRLCAMAQDMIDTMNQIRQIEMNFFGNELISYLIEGILFETVSAIEASDEQKAEVYAYALQYCSISSDSRWEFFCSEDKKIVDCLTELTNVSMDMLISASCESETKEISTNIIKLIVELMLYLEDAIINNFDFIVLNKRPPLIVLEKAITAIDKEMQRMEEENPELKQEEKVEENTNLERLYNNARSELNKDNMRSAEEYYREILKICPDDWEALFYSSFCSAYRTSYNVYAEDIPYLAVEIVLCVSDAMKAAKRQLVTKMEAIDKLGEVATRTSDLASNYFVAAMNAFRDSFGGPSAKDKKVRQVNAIINMMFIVGDSIEENFGDDSEIIMNIVCPTWEIGFTCYENCNMPVPPTLHAHYIKMLKYKPSFTCSKPVVGGSAGNSGACYVATAVYGSYDCPQVWTLRRYRDYSLAKNWLGRLFIRFYYATSPTFVRLFKGRKWFNYIFRQLLDRFTEYLIGNGYENTPYSDETTTTTN